MKMPWMAIELGLACLLVGCVSLSDGLNERGVRAFDEGRYLEAKAFFERAQMHDPGNAAILWNLASARQRLGDRAEAEQVYRQCMRLAPADPRAYHALAELLVDGHETDRAFQVLAGFKRAYPGRADPYVELAWLHDQTGDLVQARQLARRATELEPHNARAQELLGDIYRTLDLRPEAILAYRRALESPSTDRGVAAKLAALTQEVSAPLEAIARADTQHGRAARPTRHQTGR